MNNDVVWGVPDDPSNDFIAIKPVGEASKRAEITYGMSANYLIH